MTHLGYDSVGPGVGQHGAVQVMYNSQKKKEGSIIYNGIGCTALIALKAAVKRKTGKTLCIGFERTAATIAPAAFFPRFTSTWNQSNRVGVERV